MSLTKKAVVQRYFFFNVYIFLPQVPVIIVTFNCCIWVRPSSSKMAMITMRETYKDL